MAKAALKVDKQFTTTIRIADGALADRTFGVGELLDSSSLEGIDQSTLANRVKHGFLVITVVEDDEPIEEEEEEIVAGTEEEAGAPPAEPVAPVSDPVVDPPVVEEPVVDPPVVEVPASDTPVADVGAPTARRGRAK